MATAVRGPEKLIEEAAPVWAGADEVAEVAALVCDGALTVAGTVTLTIEELVEFQRPELGVGRIEGVLLLGVTLTTLLLGDGVGVEEAPTLITLTVMVVVGSACTAADAKGATAAAVNRRVLVKCILIV